MSFPLSIVRDYVAFRSLMKSQWFHRSCIEDIQTKKLRALLDHCYRHVRYYNLIFKEQNLKPEDIKTAADLQKLPVLSRTAVRNNICNLTADNFPRERLRSTITAGSTGHPLRIIHDQDSLIWINAAVMRSFRWAGFHRFDKLVSFWGLVSEHDVFPTKPWQRQMVASSFGADEGKMRRVIEYMKWFAPKGIRGYATSLYLLAKQNDGVRLDFAISTSEMLFPIYRKIIEASFGCRVFDNYSSREFMIASECDQHRGYHIAAENCILEFVKDQEQVGSGEAGRILITDLTRYGMPLVRYDIGDVGKPCDERCTCGRGLPLLESLEGRVTDIITTPSGKFLSPSAMIPVMERDVAQFQIVKKLKDLLIVKIVKGPSYAEEDTRLILDSLRKQIDDMTIEIEFAEEIPPAKSGKRVFMISEVP